MFCVYICVFVCVSVFIFLYEYKYFIMYVYMYTYGCGCVCRYEVYIFYVVSLHSCILCIYGLSWWFLFLTFQVPSFSFFSCWLFVSLCIFLCVYFAYVYLGVCMPLFVCLCVYISICVGVFLDWYFPVGVGVYIYIYIYIFLSKLVSFSMYFIVHNSAYFLPGSMSVCVS